MKWLVLVASLFVLGCEDFVTEKIVNIREDNLSPRIIVKSPKQDSNYTSIVSVSVEIVDDSLEDGDARGLLKYFSFKVRGANNNDLSGAVSFDITGKMSRDASFGNREIRKTGEGEFRFDFAPGSLDFFPTSLDVILKAEDFGGREKTRILTLRKSNGSVIEISKPEDVTIAYNSSLIVNATVTHDDGEAKKSTREVDKIVLHILGLKNNRKVELDIAEGRKGKDPDDNVIYARDNRDEYSLSYNLETGKLTYPDSETGSKPRFDLNANHTKRSSGESITDFSIKIFATDKLGIENVVEKNLVFQDENTPNLFFLDTRRNEDDSPVYLSGLISNNYLYSPATRKFTDRTRFSEELWIDLKASPAVQDEVRKIAKIEVFVGKDKNNILSSSKTFGKKIELLSENVTKDFLRNAMTTPVTTLENPSLDPNDYPNKSSVIIEVTDNQNNSVEHESTFLKDSKAPTVTVNSTDIKRNNTLVQFLTPGDSIEVNFTASDAKVADSGVDKKSYSLLLGGNPIDIPMVEDGGVHTFTLRDTAVSGLLSGDVGLKLRVADKLGNRTDKDLGTFPFFQGNPRIISAEMVSNHMDKNKVAVVGNTVTLEIKSNHWVDVSNTSVEIAGQVATVAQGDTRYKAVATFKFLDTWKTEGLIKYKITKLTDVLGGEIQEAEAYSDVKFWNKPKLSVKSIEAPGTYPQFAKWNDTITLLFESDKEIAPPNVRFRIKGNSYPGTLRDIGRDHKKWEATIRASNAVKSSGEEVTYRISNIKLRAEENVTASAVVEDSSSIIVYNRAPSVENASFKRKKADDREAGANYNLKAGDKLVLSFGIVGNRELIFSEEKPKVEFYLGDALIDTLQPAIVNNVYTYTYTLKSMNENNIEEIKYKVLEFQDKAENTYRAVPEPEGTGEYIKKLPTPTISNITLTTMKKKSENYYARRNDTITLRFETNLSNEELASAPTVQFKHTEIDGAGEVNLGLSQTSILQTSETSKWEVSFAIPPPGKSGRIKAVVSARGKQGRNVSASSQVGKEIVYYHGKPTFNLDFDRKEDRVRNDNLELALSILEDRQGEVMVKFTVGSGGRELTPVTKEVNAYTYTYTVQVADKPEDGDEKDNVFVVIDFTDYANNVATQYSEQLSPRFELKKTVTSP